MTLVTPMEFGAPLPSRVEQAVRQAGRAVMNFLRRANHVAKTESLGPCGENWSGKAVFPGFPEDGDLLCCTSFDLRLDEHLRGASNVMDGNGRVALLPCPAAAPGLD